MPVIGGIGPQAGASQIVGSSTLPSSPTFRQCYVTPSGMYVCLTDGTWSLLDAADAGTVSGQGVTNRLTKWIDGTGSVLGDSGVADDGTNVLSLRPFAVGFGLSTPAALPTGPRITAASTISTSPRGILSAQFSTDTAGARVGFQKARGTIGTPTTVVTGDTLGRLMFRGYDGTNYLEMGSIEVASNGTIAATRVPTQMIFSTATNATPSVLTTALTIGNDQSVTLAGALSVTGHTTFEGVTSTGATGTGNLAYSTAPTFTGDAKFASVNISATALPSWGASYSPLMIGANASIRGLTALSAGSDTAYVQNAYFNGSAHKYISSAAASGIVQTGGVIIFHTAPSGTAGNDVTFTAALQINNDRTLTISSLAGTGSRNVVADASGNISAPVSDARLKTNIAPLDNVLDKLAQMRGVSFDFVPTEGVALTQDGRRQVGMIADEVEKVIPEAVGFNAPIDGVEYRYINYDPVIAFLVEVAKAQQGQIDDLRARLA